MDDKYDPHLRLFRSSRRMQNLGLLYFMGWQEISTVKVRTGAMYDIRSDRQAICLSVV